MATKLGHYQRACSVNTT